MRLYTHVHYKWFACRCGVIIGNLAESVNESSHPFKTLAGRELQYSLILCGTDSKTPGLVGLKSYNRGDEDEALRANCELF